MLASRQSAIEARSTRNASVDGLRIAAAFFIVAFHSRIYAAELRELFYAGLVCFIAISAWYAMARPLDGSASHLRRMRRILAPWLFWSAAFLARDLMLSSNKIDFSMTAQRILAVSSLHLWYLPFAAAVATIIWGLRRLAPTGVLSIGALVFLVTATVLAHEWRPWSLNQPAPVPQYAQALPPVAMGVVIYHGVTARCYLGIAVAMVCAAALTPYFGLGAPYFIGAAACLAAFRFPMPDTKFAAPLQMLADCAFGVYLVHPLFHFPCRRVLGDDTFLLPVAVFLLSLAATIAVRQLGGPLARELFGLTQGPAPRKEARPSA